MIDQSKEPVQRALFIHGESEDKLISRGKEFLHTGKIRGRDSHLVSEICRWVCAGVSKSRIADKFGVSRNTVSSLCRLAEASGKMEQEKQRLASDLMDIASLCTENFRAALLANSVPSTSLMVSGAIAIDKVQVLTGQASVIIEYKRPEIDGAKAASWIEKLRAVSRPEVIDVSATDCGSDSPASHLIDGQLSDPNHIPQNHALDTTISPNPDLPMPPPPPPGGGVGPEQGPPITDGSALPEFCTKSVL